MEAVAAGSAGAGCARERTVEKETGLQSGISGETGRSGRGRVVMEAGYQGCV